MFRRQKLYATVFWKQLFELHVALAFLNLNNLGEVNCLHINSARKPE